MLKTIRKVSSIFKTKSADYRSERIQLFPFANLSNNLAFSTGVIGNYQNYEEAYFTSIDVSTAIDLIAHFAITEFQFSGSEQDVKKAETFSREMKLRTRLINDIRTMLIYGNAYEYLADSEIGIEMQFLNPKNVKVRIDEYGDIVAYVYSVAGEENDLQPERVLHFAYGRIGNSPYGYSLIHQVYNLLKLKQKLELMAAILSYKMGHPLLHAKVKNPAMIPEVEKVLQNRVQTNYDATNVEDQIAIVNQIVTDDAVDLNAISSQLDLRGLVEMIQYLQGQIDKALKVPRVFYGEPEGSNRASSYNQLKTFSLFLQSLRSAIKEELEAKLFPLLGLDVEIEFEEIVIEDEMIWGELAVKLYEAGIIDTNEARDIIGYPPLEEEQ
ncbi:phage portal protein [Geoglobus acetivorans]|uniref:Phage portal protein n=1 Tax=Geoglobus acetivorans TaxID=565033 RepID=A0ABZ3H1R3_GEOAI|nr:phage portal protein [Geoglobus acetivorans]